MTKKEIQSAEMWQTFLYHNADSVEEEAEYMLFSKLINITKEHEIALKWIQAFTESIDQPCIACKYYRGKNKSIAELQRKKRICSACNGRMGTESCRWEFGG